MSKSSRIEDFKNDTERGCCNKVRNSAASAESGKSAKSHKITDGTDVVFGIKTLFLGETTKCCGVKPSMKANVQRILGGSEATVSFFLVSVQGSRQKQKRLFSVRLIKQGGGGIPQPDPRHL